MILDFEQKYAYMHTFGLMLYKIFFNSIQSCHIGSLVANNLIPVWKPVDSSPAKVCAVSTKYCEEVRYTLWKKTADISSVALHIKTDKPTSTELTNSFMSEFCYYTLHYICYIKIAFHFFFWSSSSSVICQFLLTYSSYKNWEQNLTNFFNFILHSRPKKIRRGIVGPVSYTHLDVYKRQALRWETIT